MHSRTENNCTIDDDDDDDINDNINEKDDAQLRPTLTCSGSSHDINNNPHRVRLCGWYRHKLTHNNMLAPAVHI